MRLHVMWTALIVGVLALSWGALSDSLPPDASYRSLPSQPFSVVRAADEAQKSSQKYLKFQHQPMRVN
jgi:cytochrome c peroxidase